MPVLGSAFPGGHNPRVAFFRAAQLPASDEPALVPLVEAADDADMVEVDELDDDTDEEEFWRWMVLRGPAVENILLTSSEFMAPKPLEFQPPKRVFGAKLSGAATAVIERAGTGGRVPGRKDAQTPQGTVDASLSVARYLDAIF
ncbi:hypothetical protein Tdes44962_MAKER09127 [Teratosphaeria destructans]|uniref:Uncharacterized protein n=1 Tax=Teratosphaeria destructans TaxID=418781 RepID=A0A9W7STY5_9PEZI|nr:hypothetical protein Tdes44962_MAKER09127 [Teratosphaeria destructans]